MNETQVDFGNLDWQVGSPGVRFKAAVRDNKQLRLVEISPGIEQDWCVTGHVGYVLQGKLEIEYRQGKKVVGAGHGFFIRSGETEQHRPQAIGSVVRLILVEDLL